MMIRNRMMGRRNRSPVRYGRSTGARGKLNQAYMTGSLILAAFIGLVFNSWTAFGVAFAAVVVLNVIGGNIRLGGSRR